MLISSSGTSKFKQLITEKLLFGNEPTPELIAILVVYFVQGILGLSRLAVSFFLKDELGLSPAQVSVLLGIVGLPWMVKPLFGFMSDGLPIFGYRRRPYLMLAGLLGAASWVALATTVHTAVAATLVITLGSLSVAVSDVIADSLVVERARKESLSDAGSLQSICWIASSMGAIMTAYFSGSLLENFSTQTVFLITAAFPLIISGVSWLITEDTVSNSEPEHKNPDSNPRLNTVKHQIGQLRQALSQKVIWMPTAFIFLWQATPTSDAAFFFFTTNELGFQPEFLGRLRLVTSLATLFGIWLFQRFFKAVPFRQIFAWGTSISAALGLTALLLVTHTNRALGIDDYWFSIGDSLIIAAMVQITHIPVLVVAARICPPGIEATLFALLMSVINLATLVSYELGAGLMHLLGITENNFDKLWLLLVITNLTSVTPLVFVNWLPSSNSENPPEIPADAQKIDPEISQVVQNIMPDLLPDLVPSVKQENLSVDEAGL